MMEAVSAQGRWGVLFLPSVIDAGVREQVATAWRGGQVGDDCDGGKQGNSMETGWGGTKGDGLLPRAPNSSCFPFFVVPPHYYNCHIIQTSSGFCNNVELAPQFLLHLNIQLQKVGAFNKIICIAFNYRLIKGGYFTTVLDLFKLSNTSNKPYFYFIKTYWFLGI